MYKGIDKIKKIRGSEIVTLFFLNLKQVRNQIYYNWIYCKINLETNLALIPYCWTKSDLMYDGSE